MSAHRVAPGAQAKRFAAYLDRLAEAAEHADRATPLKSYCTGLLLPGERKSVEPMAARLYPDTVRQAHQSMHHIVADAAWSDEDMLEAVRVYREVGYDGMLMPDHVPTIAGDAVHAQAFAYTFGYIKALIAAVAAEA